MRRAIAFFVRADKLLDRLWRWGTFFVGSWAGLTWLAKRMTRFGVLNWADAAAVGFVAVIVLLLTLSAAAVAFRLLRPRAPVPQLANPAKGAEAASVSPETLQLNDKVSRRLTALENVAKPVPTSLGEAVGLLIARRQHLEGEVAFIEEIEQAVEAAWQSFKDEAAARPDQVYEIARARTDRGGSGLDRISPAARLPYVFGPTANLFAIPDYDPGQRVPGDEPFSGDHKFAFRKRHAQWVSARRMVRKAKDERMSQINGCNLAIGDIGDALGAEATSKIVQEARSNARVRIKR